MGNYMNKCDNCTANYSCNVSTGSDFQPNNYTGSVEQNLSNDNANVSVSYEANLHEQDDTNASVQFNYMNKESQDKDSLQKGYLIGEINKNKEDEEKDKENEFLKHHDSLGKKLAQKEETNATVGFSVESTQSDAHIEDIVSRDNKKGPQDLHSKHGNEIKGIEAIQAKFA